MSTIKLKPDDILDLKLLRERLARERDEASRSGALSSTRTGDPDREVELLDRMLRQVKP